MPDDNIIPFDTSLVSEVEKTPCRDDGGYGGFLFDPKFTIPQEELCQLRDVAEAFFKWAEQYPLEGYWNVCASELEKAGEKPMPYYYWKGLARQMIVALVQKYLVDRDLSDLEGPGLGGTD